MLVLFLIRTGGGLEFGSSVVLELNYNDTSIDNAKSLYYYRNTKVFILRISSYGLSKILLLVNVTSL